MRAAPGTLSTLMLVASALFTSSVLDWHDSHSPEAPDRIRVESRAEPAPGPPLGDRISVANELPETEHFRRVASGHRHQNERPLPAFEGTTIDGKSLRISEYVGRRLVLFFFNPEVEDAEFVGRAVADVARLQAKHNFAVIGVAAGSSRPVTQRFAERLELGFPVIDDSSARIAARLGLRQPMAIFGVDAEGYVEFAMGYFMKDTEDPEQVVEAQLRKALRLPSNESAQSGVLDARPSAPLFEVDIMDSDESLRLEEQIGKPVVLVFFLHTCPHCHAALAFFKEQLAAIPEDNRPLFIGLSVQNRPSAVREMLEQKDLEFFKPAFDPTGQDIMQQYGVFAGFPDVVLIDATGKIVHRTQGWNADRDPALNRMWLARIAGVRVPMLLNPKGYTGSDVCRICHEAEALTTPFTRHDSAFDTLVKHGESTNEECVGCHVVGFGEPGGYSVDESPKHLENVGCESCHGRGGPHLSPDFAKKSDYSEVCAGCHNPTHSLGFDYATFLPKVSHVSIAALSNDEREAMLAEAGKVRDVLPQAADHVGSDACKSCHESEFATWASSPHGHSLESLKSKQKLDDVACLQCHTTGMGRPGGFPKNGKGSDASLADLAKVGCESCHGPGADHVKPDATHIGSIVSLGDKCDSCVILQICGSCHDDANDPGFEFKVDEKIERQRHGTIEPGTGKPLKAVHRTPTPPASLREDLATAFRMADRRG